MGASFRESRLKKGDRQTTNKPKKDKIHTYYIMPIELRKNFYRRRGVRISYLKIVRGTLLVGGN